MVLAPLDSLNSSASPKEVDEWVSNTENNLSKLRELRKKVGVQLRQGKQADTNISTFSVDSSRGLRNTAAEDQLKRRVARTQNLNQRVSQHVDNLEQALFKVQKGTSEMLRVTGQMKASVAVVDRRMQLRSERPAQELVDDDFQKALQTEREVLEHARQELTRHIQAGQNILNPLENTKVELNQSRLNLHIDRTGSYVEVLLDHSVELEEQARLICREGHAVLCLQQRLVEQAQGSTMRHMKERIMHTKEMRRRLETEIKETKNTINQAAQDLDHKRKILKAHYAMPERSLKPGQGNGDVQREIQRFINLSPQVQAQLGDLRSKIKGSSNTGTHGRQFDVLFDRIDRDGSGVLEEDELRKAFRRLKLPPSLVSDAEISLLCGVLDYDGSGTVSITEVLDFLDGDLDVKEMEEQCQQTQELLEQMQKEHSKSLMDLRCKTAAWKIDEACLKMTAAKAMDLDGMQPPRKMRGGTTTTSALGSMLSPANSTGKPALPSPKQEKDRRHMLFQDKQLENLRSTIKAAAYTGHLGRQLDIVFSRFDKDSSGQLDHEEFRKALRRTLRIPPSAISDDEIAALCALLDADCSGAIDISDIVAFVGAEPKGSKRPGKVLNGASLEPINTVDSDLGAPTPRPKTSGNTTPVTIGNTLGGSSRRPQSQQSPRRRKCAPLSPVAADKMRTKLKAAVYTGHAGRELDVIFNRFDKDGSGQIDEDELKKALRRKLGIPPSVISDRDISSLCALLAVDRSGTVSISELLNFVGTEPELSTRSGKPLPLKQLGCEADQGEAL